MWQDKGFMKGETTDVAVAMQQLATILETVTARYKQSPADALLAQPAPGKWSKQQVLGHLIDSAINNLKRFTDAQLADGPYIITPYQQDGLMEVNHYQHLPLAHLLKLWQSLNQQIIFVAERMPAEKLARKIDPQYNQTGTKTLAWLICDYVAHMEHHFGAISFLPGL